MITSIGRQRLHYNLSREGVRSLEEEWIAESDSMVENPETVLNAGELALRTWYGPHPDIPALKCREKRCQQQNDSNIWTVTLSYTDEYEPFDRTVTPDDRPWHWDWGAASSDELLVEDNGDPSEPVANSASVPYDPPPTIPEAQAQATVTLYRLLPRPDLIEDYVNSVNDDAWEAPNGETYDAGTVRCTGYEQHQTAEQLWGDVYEYKLVLLVKKKGWNPLKILDAGTMELKIIGGVDKLVAITDHKSGSPVTSPVPLDGAGHQLAHGSPFVYNEYVGYKTRDFTKIVTG